MTDEIENTVPASEVEQETATESADLNISDLVSLKSIIDVASARGAFKPNEMVAVGQTYNKLAAFLEGAAKQAEESQKNG